MSLRERLSAIALIIFGTLSLSFFSAQSTEEAGTIIVQMKEFRNNEGLARITLFNQEKGFPDQYQLALTYGSSPVQDSASQFIFQDILYGDYAIGVFHDEDADGKLNTNFLGIPREGIGVSNNATGSFGPPKFEDCLFIVDKDTVLLSIILDYL